MKGGLNTWALETHEGDLDGVHGSRPQSVPASVVVAIWEVKSLSISLSPLSSLPLSTYPSHLAFQMNNLKKDKISAQVHPRIIPSKSSVPLIQ